MSTPIAFHHGYVSVKGNSGGMYFQLFGPHLLVTNLYDAGDAGSYCPATRGPFPAGPLSLDANFSGGSGIGAGYARINGTVYQKLWYEGSLLFTGHTAIPSGLPSPSVISATCAMSGSLKAYLNNPFIGPPGPAIIDVTISNKAVAILEMSSMVIGGQTVYTCDKVTYQAM